MPDFILNPRRVPRAPISCAARVALRSGRFFAAPSIDYSPKGCQLEAPGPLDPGARVFVELINERIPRANELSGHVAWSSKASPWRSGIAFDDASLLDAGQFFDLLAAAYPGVAACASAPDRLPFEASIAPATPPEASPLLRPEEVSVIGAVGAGIRVDALRASLGDRWDAHVIPLFALLGRGYLVVGPSDERAAAEWAPLLARAAP